MATLHFENLRGRAVTRDPREEHRASTPLELFFDLTFVVAVGRVADAYQHELAIGETARGVVYGGLMFFGIWWAWMNFTWFASAHDADDVPYRLLTFVQIAGALVFAAGVTRAVEDRWFVACAAGYVIMRVGLILSWLRVARDEPTSRTRALRYAALIAAVQVLWVGMLVLPIDAQLWVFLLLGAAELGIPVVAERALDEPPFHAEHIEERYGLFTIILLGESVLSAAAGFQDAVDDGGLTGGLLAVGLGSLLIAFAAWWLYFDNPGHLAPTPQVAFRWGYGHIVVFGSLAAIGGGLHLAASSQGHDSEIDARTAALAVALRRRRLPRRSGRAAAHRRRPGQRHPDLAQAGRGGRRRGAGRGGERSGHRGRVWAGARRARGVDGRRPRASRSGRIGASLLGISRRALTARPPRRRPRRPGARRSPGPSPR